MKSSGIQYEILVQAIFQEILKQEVATNIEVQHDVKVLGKSGITHQIDVYWAFVIAGIKYETIIQVKDWKYSIKQEQLLAFKGVLDDLPGQPRGIFVAKSGAQQGAKKFAKANGIALFELKEAIEPPPIVLELKPGTTLVAHLEAKPENDYQKATIYELYFSELSYLGDIGWLKEQNERLGAETVERALQWSGQTSIEEESFLDDQKSIACTLNSIVKELSEQIKDEYVGELEESHVFAKTVTKIFSEPTWVRNASTILPFAKVNAVSLKISVEKQREYQMPYRPVGFTRFVLTDIQDDKTRSFFVESDDLNHG